MAPLLPRWTAGKRGSWSGDGPCSRLGIKKSTNGEELSQKVGVILSYFAKSLGDLAGFCRGCEDFDEDKDEDEDDEGAEWVVAQGWPGEEDGGIWLHGGCFPNTL